MRKKTYNLDERLIHKARRLFNARTDTEAIRMALQKSVGIQRALNKLLRLGRFRVIYK
jgi:hypothetical protein